MARLRHPSRSPDRHIPKRFLSREGRDKRMADKKVDVLIIGSGHTGGLAAKILTEKGISCTMLDAGPMINFERDRILKPASQLPYRGFDAPGRHPHIFQSSEFSANQWVDEKGI